MTNRNSAILQCVISFILALASDNLDLYILSSKDVQKLGESRRLRHQVLHTASLALL